MLNAARVYEWSFNTLCTCTLQFATERELSSREVLSVCSPEFVYACA